MVTGLNRRLCLNQQMMPLAQLRAMLLTLPVSQQKMLMYLRAFLYVTKSQQNMPLGSAAPFTTIQDFVDGHRMAALNTNSYRSSGEPQDIPRCQQSTDSILQTLPRDAWSILLCNLFF